MNPHKTHIFLHKPRIALEHAGQKEEEVQILHTKLEYEDRVWQYEVEFYHPELHIEYDYDIDALTGEILSFDMDTEYSPQGAGHSPANDGQIAEEKAKQIALEYADVAEEDTQRMKVEFDYDWCVESVPLLLSDRHVPVRYFAPIQDQYTALRHSPFPTGQFPFPAGRSHPETCPEAHSPDCNLQPHYSWREFLLTLRPPCNHTPYPH